MGNRLNTYFLAAPLLLSPAAFAQDAPQDPHWYVGLPVAVVQLEAGAGGALPEESLDALLRARQNEPLEPKTIALDIATLFRVGEFSAVEADVVPWLSYDPVTGEPAAGVALTYLVYPAPTISKIKVHGRIDFKTSEILAQSGLTPGQPHYPSLDNSHAEERIRRWLVRQGYANAQIAIKVEESAGEYELTILVDQGVPNVIERLTFAGNIPEMVSKGGNRKLYRWVHKAGVREGEAFAPDAINRAQQKIREHLGSMRRGILRRRHGWVEARVTWVKLSTRDGAVQITYTVDPGRRLSLDVRGIPFRGDAKARQALGIDDRLRLTRGYLDEAPVQLREWLQNRGYYNATSTVELLEPTRTDQVLSVRVERGARHFFGDDLGFVGIDFSGNENLSDADLQRVVDQASYDVIRRDFFTEAELEKGLVAATELYRARGYQSATLAQQPLAPADIGLRGIPPLRILSAPIRKVFGIETSRKIIPRVTVEEGPLTIMESVTIETDAEEVPLDFLDDAIAELAEAPYSPHQVEFLARRIVEKHRSSGYLEADVKVKVYEIEPLRVRCTIEVDADEKILLRSMVTRGLRRTRPDFVKREVDIALGDPITSTELSEARENLYNLGIFRTVDLQLLGDDALRDLVVSVDERGRYSWEVGGGVSTDQGLRGFFRATRRNLWGTAHRVNFLSQIGLDYGSENLQDFVPDITSPEGYFALSYTAPRFPTRRMDLVLDALLFERRQERTWRMARTGGGVALQWQLDKKGATEIRPGIRLETRQLQQVDSGALLSIDPWIDRLVLGVPSLWRIQETVTVLLIRDHRNDRISPTRGWLISSNAEWAPGLDWSSIHDQTPASFVKAEARMSSYIPLGRFVLRVSGEAGRGISLNEHGIPLEDRYRLGGTGSLRGFRRDGVGPRNESPRIDIDWPNGIRPVLDYAIRDNPERWVPTGGDTSAVSTIELVMPLPALGMKAWDGWAAAGFADIGNVWQISHPAGVPGARPTSTLPRYAENIPLLRYGIGGGIRVATPVGPLQVDLASNPQSLFSSGSRRTLLVEGWEEPPFRFHLTLGALW